MEKFSIKLSFKSGNYFLNPEEKTLLQQDSFFKIYMAKDDKNGLYAIKVTKYLKVIIEDLKNLGGIKGKELEALKILNSCSYTPKIIDYGIYYDWLFIVMDSFEGNLIDLINKKGVIPIIDALKILKQISKALSDIHALGIIYRDVKPSNILICEGDYKLDFGTLAIKKKIVKGEVCGTPLYMAPEVSGRKDYDISVDIYSLGQTLKEIITGKFPHKIKERHMEKFDPKLRDLISSMTSHDPKKRPTAEEVHKIAIELEREYSNKELSDFEESSKPTRTFSGKGILLDFIPKVGSENHLNSN